MAAYSLPKQRREPTFPMQLPSVPGTSEASRAGIQGFMSRLPGQMRGTDQYQAGIDQSTQAQAEGAQRGSMAEQMMELTRAQQQSLAQHKAYREGLNQAQQQVDVRNNDLRLAQNLLIATDPTMDKSVRKFMLAGLSNAAGVDPKGEYSQSIQKMVLGMAPEALEALRGSFGNDIQNAPPGMISQQLNGIFSGATPIENVLGQVKQHQEKKAAAVAAATSPGLPLTSGAPAAGVAPVEEGAVAGEVLGEFDRAGLPPARPDPQQRQEVIATAGKLSESQIGEQLGAPPQGAAPPPDVGPAPQAEPVVSPPAEEIAPTAPMETPSPSTTPAQAPPSVEPAAAAAAEAAGAGPPPATAPAQEAPPVGAPERPKQPGEQNSRMHVDPELRKQAEETGDKILLDAIAKIDARNAVLDSDAGFRKSLTSRVGAASPSAQTGAAGATPPPVPGGAVALPGADISGTPGAALPAGTSGAAAAAAGGAPAAAPATEPGVEMVTGTPLSLAEGTKGLISAFSSGLPSREDATTAIANATNAVVASLPPDPVTGIKPSDAFGVSTKGDIVSKSGTEASKHVAQALTTETAPKGPMPGDKTNQWIADVNEANRKNPLPVNPNLPALEKKDIPPHEQEMRQGLKGMLPGWDPDPSKRINAADMARPFPKAENTEAYEKHLREVNEKRDRALTDLYTPGTRLIEILQSKDGKELVGKGIFMTPGEAAQTSERARRVMGWDDKDFGIASKLYGDKAEAYVRGIAGLSNEQRAALSREITANFLRLEAAVALAQSPRGDINQKEREFAREQVGSADMGSAEIKALLKNNLDLTTKAANAQFASTTGNGVIDWRALPREVRDKVVALNAIEPGLFNPEYVAQMHATSMQEDRRKAGAPVGENEYLTTTGGNRPEHHEAAFQKDKAEKQAEEAKVRERAAGKEQRDIETHAIQKRHAEIAEDVEKRNKEKWEEDKRRHAAQEARQAMLDARHAQEKMAAAFQHIGAMIAGSVKAANLGGGSGISAGPEDTSAFRIAAPPQRQAPRLGGIQLPTRYGGPIKKMQ